MQTNTYTKAVTAKDSLIVDILCREFGFPKVSEAMSYINYYNACKKEKRSTLSEHLSKLSCAWQMGNANEYLESLNAELQQCIICHLMEDYVNDKTRAEA
jgi:hypothetical protein